MVVVLLVAKILDSLLTSPLEDVNQGDGVLLPLLLPVASPLLNTDPSTTSGFAMEHDTPEITHQSVTKCDRKGTRLILLPAMESARQNKKEGGSWKTLNILQHCIMRLTRRSLEFNQSTPYEYVPLGLMLLATGMGSDM